MEFEEKADSTILAECKDFVEKNAQGIVNYYVYSQALRLFIKLSESLVASHKDFEEAIKVETDKISAEANGAKDLAIYRFNQANHHLILDAKAHKVLHQLELIYKKYQGQQVIIPE